MGFFNWGKSVTFIASYLFRQSRKLRFIIDLNFELQTREKVKIKETRERRGACNKEKGRDICGIATLLIQLMSRATLHITHISVQINLSPELRDLLIISYDMCM